MSAGASRAGGRGYEEGILESFRTLYRNYYKDEIGRLGRRYPEEQRSLHVDYADVSQRDPGIADDWIHQDPAAIREHAEEALRTYDLPVDISLDRAVVRLFNLGDSDTYYPGEFLPDDRAGEFTAIEGEVAKRTSTYARLEEAAFECQRCGALTRVPQSSGAGSRDTLQDPHECSQCERQGPFEVNPDESDLVHTQKLLLREPPERADGDGEDIPVYVEADLCDTASIGDRITANGVVHLMQSKSSQGSQDSPRLDPYLDCQSIEIEETDHHDIEITSEERERIEALASGAEGDPLEVAAKSLAPNMLGNEHIAKMAVLQIIGGVDAGDRGDIHMLLLGDPGTYKSRLIERVNQIAPRVVLVSGKGATVAGLTASATRDEFDGAEWTLDPGAFVKANGGLVAIDELDDMAPEERAAMLDPMSKQTVSVNKAGINATLSTKAGVLAAGNPKYGRFDQYESAQEQFDFKGNLLSRFDLIYTLTDRPDPDFDEAMAENSIESREAEKKKLRGDDLTDEEAARVEGPVSEDLLTKWLALAKRQPAPTIAAEEIKAGLKDQYVTLRGVNGYGDDATVSITARKLPSIQRISEAAAKLELSETVEERHADVATTHIGISMQDYGKNEDGDLDADVKETGTSSTKKGQEQFLERMIKDVAADYDDGVPRDRLYDEASEEMDLDETRVDHLLDEMSTDKGWIYEPQPGKTVSWIGRT